MRSMMTMECVSHAMKIVWEAVQDQKILLALQDVMLARLKTKVLIFPFVWIHVQMENLMAMVFVKHVMKIVLKIVQAQLTLLGLMDVLHASSN